MRRIAFRRGMNGGPEPAADASREIGFFVNHEAGDHLPAAASVDVCFFPIQLVAELSENLLNEGQNFYRVPMTREGQVVGVARVVYPVPTSDFRDGGICRAKNQVSNGRASWRPGGQNPVVAKDICQGLTSPVG